MRGAALLISVFVTCAAGAAPYEANPRWRQAKRGAEAAWQRAKSKLDERALVKANRLYQQAWNESARGDFAAFWDVAYSAAVGCLHEAQQYPCRGTLRDVLITELYSTKSDAQPFGFTQISQLVAMAMLDAPFLLNVTQAWAHSFDEAKSAEPPVKTLTKARGWTVPVRIGYLSGHFGDHPVGHHIGTLLRLHTRPVSEYKESQQDEPISGETVSNVSFVVHCLSTSPDDGSAIYKRNRAACDSWTEIPSSTSASDAAATIRSHHLDVLVSLDGYDRGHRMDVLSLRPAPFQVSFFGFLGTTGASRYIDAIIGDEHTIPTPSDNQREAMRRYWASVSNDGNSVNSEGASSDDATDSGPMMPLNRVKAGAELWYAEAHILRHPTTFFVTDYQTHHPEVMAAVNSAAPLKADNHVSSDASYSPSWLESYLAISDAKAFNSGDEATAAAHDDDNRTAGAAAEVPFALCSFSQLFKVGPEIFNSWLNILRNSGNESLLYLVAYPPVGKPGLLAHPALVADPALAARVRFLELLPRNKHLLDKRRICGLGLDTPYYNGHTSVSDLLWAGVPVLTLSPPQSTMAGRAAGSLIKAAGGPAHVFLTDNFQDYEDTAVKIYQAYERQRARVRHADATRSTDAEVSVELNAAGDVMTGPTAGAASAVVASGGGAAECVTCRKNVARYAADVIPNPHLDDPALLWRPTHDCPLFDRQRWVRGFEEMLVAALQLMDVEAADLAMENVNGYR